MKELPQLIKECIEHHYNVIWENNVRTATDIDQFEKWAATMAKLHASVTLRFLYTEDEFEQAYNATIEPTADQVD